MTIYNMQSIVRDLALVPVIYRSLGFLRLFRVEIIGLNRKNRPYVKNYRIIYGEKFAD